LADPGAGDGFQGALKPFFMVERTLSLGIEWKVYTTVSAFDPIVSPFTLNLPLLAGEKPTTMGLTVKDGQATLSFNPGVRQISWESDLDIDLEKPLELTAKSGPYAESWTLDAANFWRIETAGLTPIYNLAPSGYWNPKWRPWPNESVKIAVSRPEPVPGRFLVVDKANLEVSLGEENRRNELTLSLRSSFGGPFAFDLPVGSEIQTLSMDNQNLPSSSVSGPKVVLPLTPGNHSVKVSWLETKSLSTVATTPALNLDLAAANIVLNIKTPQDRWTLLARGPSLGPAVLFWSMAGAILVISLFLGRIKITPLGTVSWFVLFLGLAQLSVFWGLFVAGWLMVFGLRGTRARIKKNLTFNAAQIGLVIWTLIALLAIYNGLRHGLLEAPVMAVTGYHNSSDHNLFWFIDRAYGPWPEASVITIPDRFYNYVMLAWALWLAISLIGWMRWLWNSFSHQGFWAATPRFPKFPSPPAQNPPAQGPPAMNHPGPPFPAPPMAKPQGAPAGEAPDPKDAGTVETKPTDPGPVDPGPKKD
jgi:hypothetical protein